VTDVLPHDTGGTGDDGDRRRAGRQAALPRPIEQPLGRQARLERFEPQGQVAEPRRLDRLDVELQAAVGLIQVHPPVRDDPKSSLRLERGPHPVVAEPDALELAALVLEREVGVPRR